MVSVQDAVSCYLWHGLWGGRVCSQAFLKLFSYSKNQHISLQVAASTLLLHSLFHLPVSAEAYAQFQELVNILFKDYLCKQVLTYGPTLGDLQASHAARLIAN